MMIIFSWKQSVHTISLKRMDIDFYKPSRDPSSMHNASISSEFHFMLSIIHLKDEKLLLYIKDKKNMTPYGYKKKYKWNCDCPENKYQNDICDDECNKFECFWDGHDCDYQRPKSRYYFDPRMGSSLKNPRTYVCDI